MKSMKRMVEIVLPVITIGIYQIITGCTLLGTAVGTFQDKKLPDYRTVDASWKPEVLNKGAEIRIHTTEGETFKGKYIGDWQSPLSEYEEEYNLARSTCSERVILPHIHDWLLVRDKFDMLFDARFLGFDPQRIWLQKFGSKKARPVPLKTIREIETRSAEKIDLGSINQLKHRSTVGCRDCW